MMSNLYCFSDEAYINQAYKCLNFIYSHDCKSLKKLRNDISNILHRFQREEFKWSKVSNNDNIKFAKSLIDLFFSYEEVKILSICAYKEDMYKFQIKKSKKNSFLSFLYYMAIKEITSRRDDHGINVHLLHNKGSGFHWDKVMDFLQKVYQKQTYQEVLFTQEELSLIGLKELASYGDLLSDRKDRFILNTVERVCSKEEPLIQLADLFAGLHGGSFNLIQSSSQKAQYKWKLIYYIQNKLQLQEGRLPLITAPSNRINFWHFK